MVKEVKTDQWIPLTKPCLIIKAILDINTYVVFLLSGETSYLRGLVQL